MGHPQLRSRGGPISDSSPELRFRADRPRGASFIGQPFMVSSHGEFQCPFSDYLPLILGEAVVSSHDLSTEKSLAHQER